MRELIKYLPVDGDIIQGDWFFHKGNLAKSNVWEEGKPAKKLPRGCKRAKPFVITQNIKVGDKVDLMKVNGEIVFLKKEFILPKCNKDGYVDLWDIATVHVNNFYEILGEVSPNATFVKDGEEHEARLVAMSKDREMNWCLNEIMIRHNRLYEKEDMDKVDWKRNFYQLKCPCCGDWK